MLDCIIIGAGPAGLAAATYLARFRRQVLVLDAGASRAAMIPLTRNTPGFPDGVSGATLLERLRQQAAQYGVEVRKAQALSAAFSDGAFSIDVERSSINARTLLLATGVANVAPAFADHDEAVARGLLRYCPVCDGHEVIDKRVAIFGNSERSVAEMDFLRTFTRDVTLFAWDASAASALEAAGAASPPLVRSVAIDGQTLVIDSSAGRHFADSSYACLGVRPRSDLAEQLGAELASDGCILVDDHQRTRVPGLFAAGDVVEALDQIAVAWGHAAVAATTIHNDLRKLDA